MSGIGSGATLGHYPHPHHHGHGQPGVKIYNDVNVATPYHHGHHSYHPHLYPHHNRVPAVGGPYHTGGHPAHRGAIGAADPFGPQHGLFGNIWKWTKNHKDDIINVATTVAGQVLGPQHGLDMNPNLHKEDSKIQKIAQRLSEIDKQEREKEAELSGLMKKKHVLSSAIQTRVMNNHLEHLAHEAAEPTKSEEE